MTKREWYIANAKSYLVLYKLTHGVHYLRQAKECALLAKNELLRIKCVA